VAIHCSDDENRLEALRLAVSSTSITITLTPDQVVERANAYFTFLKGNLTPKTSQMALKAKPKPRRK